MDRVNYPRNVEPVALYHHLSRKVPPLPLCRLISKEVSVRTVGRLRAQGAGLGLGSDREARLQENQWRGQYPAYEMQSLYDGQIVRVPNLGVPT